MFRRNQSSKSNRADRRSSQTHLQDDKDGHEDKKRRFFAGDLSIHSLRRRFLPRLFYLLGLVFLFLNTASLRDSANSILPSDGYITVLDHRTNGGSPTNGACDGYRGIYHIDKGDIGGAAGTIFFQFVIGQIMWAEEHNFKPWVHLNNVSYVIYDQDVHGKSTGVDVKMLKGMRISNIVNPIGHRKDVRPGPPIGDPKNFNQTDFHFDGDGVWNHYFEPVSDFVPGDKSCENKPLVTMTLKQVTPGVHGFSGAPRAWRYHYLKDYITKPHIPLNDWLAPQRHLGHNLTSRYIQFVPQMREKAENVNPNCSIENSCLGIHIRHSDKSAGRRIIETDDFLPYVKQFLAAGGKWVYLATDSSNVIEHIKKKWPENVQRVIRSMGDDIVRSSNEEAVFDIGAHHRTNQEVLIEILALSKCQFMIHGLSAVTESSIWINVDLHYTSVNLEDPLHPTETDFGNLVAKVLEGGNARAIVRANTPKDWWLTRPKDLNKPSHVKSCDSVNGILHISHVGSHAGTVTAFFTSVLNQLIYAEKNNLKPWIHLTSASSYIYDDEFHGTNTSTIQHVTDTFTIPSTGKDFLPHPGSQNTKLTTSNIVLQGNGIWTSYFQPVSDFVPSDQLCKDKPIFSLDEAMVNKLTSLSPDSSKAWQYDEIPNDLWNPNGSALKAWREPMRKRANEIIKKYFKIHPFLLERAQSVNPVSSASGPCLAVHLRNHRDKKGMHRETFSHRNFREYFEAFQRAGGKHIYIASDTRDTIESIMNHYPPTITKMIRTQGELVVRSSEPKPQWQRPWAIHMLEKHQRTNSEALVDVLAMSKCQLLLHGNSALSEAAIYLNLDLHDHSVNWEDPDKMNVTEFESMAKQIIQKDTKKHPQQQVEITSAIDGPLANVTILQGNENRKCRRNAIVILAQKTHSSYGRDSFALLLKSLKLINENYLSLNNHSDNTDVMIFHTGDFTRDDMDILVNELGPSFRDILYFVDISNSPYWRRPKKNLRDNPEKTWKVFPLFSEGYRRMIHFFAIDIWSFFKHYQEAMGCEYEYIMRFDEDSFLRSPIKYDIFDYMKSNDLNYGFRLCAYELKSTNRIQTLWKKTKMYNPIREIDFEMCGIYNNFFVAKVSFFQSPQVQKFLNFVKGQGLIYRKRLGDLQIHSLTVYAYSEQEKIHRFLDFTYEHGTTIDNCVHWGGIQAGYDDPNPDPTLDNYWAEKVTKNNCTLMKDYTIKPENLSPTYQHLPDHLDGKSWKLRTIMAGDVELDEKGSLSG